MTENELSTLWKGARWIHNPGDYLRKKAHGFGPCNPIGDGDSKTQTPGTYRPVGPTCPASCDRLIEKNCYALMGNVRIHQKRSSPDIEPALRAAGVCFIWGTLTNRLTRLHVSGDFGTSSVDPALQEYVKGLVMVANTVNRLAGKAQGTSIAWSYTHVDGVTNETPWLVSLRKAGIHVRLSDRATYNGAIVGNFHDFQKIRRAIGGKLVKCRAQLEKAVSCRTCRLCWERPDLTVLFTPEGAGKARLARALDREWSGAEPKGEKQ